MARQRWRALPLALVLVLACAWIGTEARAASGDELYRQGVSAAQSGRYVAAAHEFERAILLRHNDPNTYYQLGLVYSKLRRWNDAVWALATARGDDAFATVTPAIVDALNTAVAAGGASEGPPVGLKSAAMAPMKLTLAEIALIEAHSAIGSLGGNSVYFVAPAFSKQVTPITATALTGTAADLQNNSNTVFKVVYLSATPATYASLQAYARALFGQLNLQRAVVVAITPLAATAYTDRLELGATQEIASSQQRSVSRDPVNLAAQIARMVVRRADDNDASSTQRTVVAAVAVVAVLVAALSYAIWRVGRRDTPARADQVRSATGTQRARVR